MDDGALRDRRSGDEGLVLLEQVGRVSVITLDRARKRNALSAAMLKRLLAVLETAIADSATAAIVLTGAGSAFCAGDDLDEVSSGSGAEFDTNIDLLQQVSTTVWTSTKPTIAALNGAAIGGGLELTLACDLRLACTEAVFACPEISWGLICTNGATTLLPAIVGRGRALEMLLTGSVYDSAWAQAAGLVNEVHPRPALLARALELAEQFAAQQTAVAVTRRLLQAGAGDLSQALEREASAVGRARRSEEATTSLARFADQRRTTENLR